MRTFRRVRRLASFVLLFVFLLGLAGFGQQRFTESTIDDIYASVKFSPKTIRGFQWIKGGKGYSCLETDSVIGKTDLWGYDVATGGKTLFVDGSALTLNEGENPFKIENYIWSPDEQRILFTGIVPARALKTGGDFFLFDLKLKQFKRLTDSGKEQLNVKFSPDGKTIGFVRANNLYLLDLATGQETQLTFDGAEHVLNGHFDWVYEEEFGIIDGWQWSPDGRYIAYWQLDETREPEFPIMNFLPLHQEVLRMRYPKAGDPNAIVKIGVIDLSTKGNRWMELGAPLDSTQDTYVPRIKWTNTPGLLAVQRLNRDQNKLDLTLVDVRSGVAKIILTESDTTWVDVRNDLTFLKKSDRFVWSSDRSGYMHLYLYRLDGTLIRQLTRGKWDVEKLIGVDEASGRVYFTAAMMSPLGRDLYSVKLDGMGLTKITHEVGTNDANFAPDNSIFLHTYSDVNTPTRTSLRKADGTLIRVINDGAIEALRQYKVSPKIFFTFTTSDGIVLNGWMIKPIDFDSTKKYPVLMAVYGGPGSQMVRNSWGGTDFLWYQVLAQKGYVIISVDNRGTGARGKQFKTVTYKNLGVWEANDQIEGAMYLRTLPYVDASRIGIWGWSYGGYMTLMSMLLGADVFKAGVSVAPVTHWKFYDTIYTERYMLTPQKNPEGYEKSAPLSYAKNLKGKLLIVHGTADDNVHWQNTVSIVNEFIREGKQFETAFYPGGMHGIGRGKVRAHLFTKITNFISENL
jgi:dipeptidyl-peptidase-4